LILVGLLLHGDGPFFFSQHNANFKRILQKYSKQELILLQAELMADPNNKETEGLCLYTKPARKKLAAIAEAIAWHLADERELKGNPIPVSGYSGRNSKKRH
jgi:hypothetical protein